MEDKQLLTSLCENLFYPTDLFAIALATVETLERPRAAIAGFSGGARREAERKACPVVSASGGLLLG